MKKILYVGNFSFPNGNASGSRVLGNGYLFEKLGYEVFYIGLDNTLSQNSILKDTKKIFDNFRYYNLPYPVGIKGWLAYSKRFKEVITLVQDEDLYAVIIYGSPTLSLFGRLIRQWCRKNEIKFITDCVDWLSVSAGGILYRSVKYIDTIYQKCILNFSADGVIAVSSYLSKYYNGRGCQTVVIPPLVNVNKFILDSELYCNNDVMNLIYVGRPFAFVFNGRRAKEASYKDRLDKVISILYCLRDMPFVFNIYGLTKDQYLEVIPGQKYFISVLGNKIQFHGFINNIDAIKEVSKADFTILFRDVNRMTTAGFPTKFVETISCGTPIITTKTSDLEKFLKPGKNGFFVDITDHDALLKQIKDIISLDRSSIRLMKKYCKDSNLFSYHNYTNELNQFMKTL